MTEDRLEEARRLGEKYAPVSLATMELHYLRRVMASHGPEAALEEASRRSARTTYFRDRCERLERLLAFTGVLVKVYDKGQLVAHRVYHGGRMIGEGEKESKAIDAALANLPENPKP